MTQQLQEDIVRRFGVTHAVAEKMIKKQSARARLKASVTKVLRRVTAADETNFDEDPQAWRQEVQRRMQAVEIMEEGVKELKDTQKLLKRIIEAEQKLVAKKTGSINKKDDDWWDMQHSGWAMGGREMFAQKLFNILNGLDEAKLAAYIMDKIGFKRSIPIDEDDIAPLVPMDIAPGQAMPGEEEPVPEDAEGVEAMLVRGVAVMADTKADIEKWIKNAAKHIEKITTEKDPEKAFMKRTLGFTKGPKLYRVFIHNPDDKYTQSAYCFIDMEGNIYKADGWKRPAKGIRGTIYNVDPNSIDQYTTWLYRR